VRGGEDAHTAVLLRKFAHVAAAGRIDKRLAREQDGGFRRDLRGGGGERAEPGGALRRDGAGPDRHPRRWQYDRVSSSRVQRADARSGRTTARACGSLCCRGCHLALSHKRRQTKPPSADYISLGGARTSLHLDTSCTGRRLNS